MSDGAHAGVGAARALDTILGNEPQPSETGEKTMSPVEMRAHIEAAPAPDSAEFDYDGAARFLAKHVLAYFLAHPEHAQLPASAKYEFVESRERPDGEGWKECGTDYWGRTVGIDLWQNCVKPSLSESDYEAVSDFTGFMWGWAVNAARYCVELPPVPNPALVTIGSAESKTEVGDR